jgi:hypothetical protein
MPSGGTSRTPPCLAAQAGDANHKKFVQIAGENGQELDTFEERVALVEGFL